MSLKNKSLLSFVSPSTLVCVPVPIRFSFSGPCTKHLARVSYSETIGPDYYTNVVLPFMFKIYVQFSIGTPNNYSFICRQSTTTLKEYVGISHVSVSVCPGGRLPHSTPRAYRRTHQSVWHHHDAHSPCVSLSGYQRGCDMGPYCSAQGRCNHSYR